MKKLILVTSPPACGKTFISRKLAKALPNCVYLDKDTLIVLSKQIFKVAGEEYNRSSDFFQREIRDYEYYAVLDFAFEALEYNDTVLINAPFTEEIRDNEYLDNLRAKLKEKDAELFVVWVHTDVEVCHERMIKRASDRDGSLHIGMSILQHRISSSRTIFRSCLYSTILPRKSIRSPSMRR